MKRMLFVFFFLALVVFPIRTLGEEQISSTSSFDIAPSSSSESIVPITIPINLSIPTSTEIQVTPSTPASEASTTLPLLPTSTITESTTTTSTSPALLVPIHVAGLAPNNMEGTELNSASLSDLDLATSSTSSTDKTDPGAVSLSLAVSSNSVCGDMNQDGKIDDLDPQVIISHIFDGGQIPAGVNADVNGDDSIDISDAVYLIAYMKGGGSAPKCPNLPPVFVDFNPPQTATALTPYTYSVKATDPENEPLIFSLLENPSGMAIASTTGQIDWTPIEAQATSTPYSVMIFVSDGVNNATTSYQIVVGPKAPPDNNNPGGGTVTIGVPAGGGALLSPHNGSSTIGADQFPIFINFDPPRNATATWLYACGVNATSSANRPLSFSLPNAPPGMWIIPSTGFILWQPDLSHVSSTPYSIVVQVSDGINTTSVNYFLTVSNPPVKKISFVPLKLNTEEPEEILVPTESQPAITTSTPTSSLVTSAETSIPGNRSFAALIFSGLLDLLKNFGAWLQLNAGIVSLYLWLFLVLFLLIFWLRRKREKEEEKSETIVPPVAAIPEEANALLAEIADRKKPAEPEIKEAEEVIELTPPLNLNFKKISDSSRNN